MPNRFTWIAVLLLVTAALLRVFAWHGEMSPDASVYAQYAWQLGHGQLDLSTDDQYIHRLPVYAPVAPLYRAFGVSTASTLLWPLLCSLLQIAMAMLFARRLFGWSAALVAGLLLSCYPLDVLESARLMPDVPHEATGVFGDALPLAELVRLASAADPAAAAAGVDRMDVRPGDGIVKVRFDDAVVTEVTLDINSGAVLHVGERNDVFLERLHSGEIFGAAVMQVLRNTITLTDWIPTNTEYAGIGAVILVGVATDETLRRALGERMRRRTLQRSDPS